MAFEIFGRRDGLDRVLIVMQFAEQKVEPFRPLEPPVTEQLGVVRRDGDRRPVHHRGEPLRLLLAVEHEVAGMARGTLHGGRPVVDLLVIRLAGDPVILDARVDALAVHMDVWADVIIIQVPADIAVVIAIGRVAGIAFFGAPYLLRRFEVARKCGDAGGAEDGGVQAVARPRIGIEQSMRFREEELEADVA